MHMIDTQPFAENALMADNTERIARRIASIASAKPVAFVSPPSKPESKRKDQRRAVYRHGRLTVAGGVKVDCIIVDVSENGARIELDGASALPDIVLLSTVMTGEKKRARVVWRRENTAGLSFLIENKSCFGGAKGPALRTDRQP